MPRPIPEEKTERRTLLLAPSLLAKIEKWRKSRPRISTWTAAVRELLAAGLRK